MKNKILPTVGILLMIILLTGIVSAAGTGISFSTDKKVYRQGDTIVFTVKNTGKSPIYVSDKVFVIESPDKSVPVLKIDPGQSYSWKYDSSGLSVGKYYKGMIYWGKTKNDLQSLYTQEFKIKKPCKGKKCPPTPVPEIDTIVLTSVGILGMFVVSRKF